MAKALIPYPFTEEGLRSALEALGTTADAVARNLEAMGFKGHLDQCRYCPVANYATAALKGAVAVDVHLDDDDSAPFLRAYASLDASLSGGAHVEAEGTSAVADFIRMFDAALFPRLIEEDSDV